MKDSDHLKDIAVDDDGYDPDYNFFFQNLKPSGTAYVLEVGRRTGNVTVKYEEKDELRIKTSNNLRLNSPTPQRKLVMRNKTKFAPGSKGSASKVADVPCQKSGNPLEINNGYSLFLGYVKLIRGCPVFRDEDGNEWRYEESADEVSDAEDSIAEFKDRLMAILQKPYDPKEYRDLLKEASYKRPVCHHKDIRGRGGRFRYEDKPEESYLDLHKDLKRKLKAAQRDNLLKALNLLRGLIFYLKNACWPDAFVPWKDKSWLEALDRSNSIQH